MREAGARLGGRFAKRLVSRLKAGSDLARFVAFPTLGGFCIAFADAVYR